MRKTQLASTIRKILLKINLIEQAVSAHQVQQAERQAQQEAKEYHENWAQLMRSDNTVREEDKPVERPVFIDSVQWGR